MDRSILASARLRSESEAYLCRPCIETFHHSDAMMSDSHNKHAQSREECDDRPKQCQKKMSASNNSRKKDIQLSKALSWVLRHSAPSLGLHISPDGFVPVHDVLTLNHSRFRMNGDGGGGQRQPKYTVEDVERVVENNDKQRFRLEWKPSSGAGGDNASDEEMDSDGKVKVLCIRANQGHSLKTVQSTKLLIALTNEELSNPNLQIIHGTTRKAWDDYIQHKGLSRMKRNHIHFATGLPSSKPGSSTKQKQHKQQHQHDNANTTDTPISGMRSSSEVYIYINRSKCARDCIPFYRSENGVILTAGVKEKGMLPVEYIEKVVAALDGSVIFKG